MKKTDARYSVKQLSELAGVSIRTLHHYDQIGLLKPAERAESRYRYYQKPELFRLQQILFYRELDYSLAEIKSILDDPAFDLKESLQSHRAQLINRIGRTRRLLDTIDKTIVQLENETDMISDKEMYEGFSQTQVDEMRSEAIKNWGEEQVMAAEQKVKQMGKDQWKKVQKQGDDICERLAQLMDREPSALQVQQEVANYHQHLCTFYEVSEERYRALGEMYIADERFTAHFEKFGPGLAQFLNRAIQIFCDHGMKVQ